MHIMTLMEEVGAVWGVASLFGWALWTALVRIIHGKA